MDIALTLELEKQIADQVASGHYTDASAVVRAGLQRLFEAEKAREELDAMIQVGLDQLDRGEGIEWPVARERIRAEIKARQE